MNENMQPESLSEQEVKQPEPPPVQHTIVQKRNKTAIILGMFLVILCVAVAGLGFLAYKLNSNITATQQRLTTLQNEHAKLQSNYEKLTADLNQTKSDLEKTNGDLTSAQADLKKSQDQSESLQDKIDLARKKAEILYAFSTGENAEDVLAIDTLIKETNDKELLAQWNSFALSPSLENSTKFLIYLMGSFRDELK